MKKTPLKASQIAAAKFGDQRGVKAPRRKSFEEFLLNDARVPSGRGLYGPYSFQGREALLAVVQVVDKIISEKLVDAEVALAGGAQFGKTILELNKALEMCLEEAKEFPLVQEMFRQAFDSLELAKAKAK